VRALAAAAPARAVVEKDDTPLWQIYLVVAIAAAVFIAIAVLLQFT
jgi:hypothetical protein